MKVQRSADGTNSLGLRYDIISVNWIVLKVQITLNFMKDSFTKSATKLCAY